MNWLNRITVLVLTGFSILICIESLRLGVGTRSKLGPGFMPLLVSVLLFSLCMLVLILDRGGAGRARKSSTDVKTLLRPFVFAAVLFAYMLLLDLVGYLILTFCLIFLMCVIADPRKWLWYVLFAATTTLLSFLFFDTLFRLHLPRGWFYLG